MGGGLGGGIGGGGPRGSVGAGGSRWGEWGGGGAQAPLTSPCPPSNHTIIHKSNPNLCSQLVWPCQPC